MIVMREWSVCKVSSLSAIKIELNLRSFISLWFNKVCIESGAKFIDEARVTLPSGTHFIPILYSKLVTQTRNEYCLTDSSHLQWFKWDFFFKTIFMVGMTWWLSSFACWWWGFIKYVNSNSASCGFDKKEFPSVWDKECRQEKAGHLWISIK